MSGKGKVKVRITSDPRTVWDLLAYIAAGYECSSPEIKRDGATCRAYLTVDLDARKEANDG